MIKNNAQLTGAQERLRVIEDQLRDLRANYAGAELDLFSAPLLVEMAELTTQVAEYRALRDLTFHDAVQQTLASPVLIENIGELLSKLRIAAKLTQAEMAERVGWQQANLSRFESENYSSQTISKIAEYANALGVWLHVSPSLTDRPAPQTRYVKDLREQKLWVDIVSTAFSSQPSIDLANWANLEGTLLRSKEEIATG